MPLETVTEEQFRSVFGDVPELTQPSVFSEGDQKIIVPFDRFQIEDHGSRHKIGILETSPYDASACDRNDDTLSYPDASNLIRVRYDSLYGLRARTWQVLRIITRDAWSEEKEEPELILLFSDMKYDCGSVSIFYRSMPASFFHANYDLLLRNPNSHRVSIEVRSNSLDLEEKPPIAQILYSPNDQEPIIRGEFVNAEYDEALNNGVEERKGKLSGEWNHPYTVFLCEFIIGLRLGSIQFQDKQSGNLRQFHREAKLNPPRPYPLKGSPYTAGVYFGYRNDLVRGGLGHRRLSFARMNRQTGEEWVLSVPDWINSRHFMNDLSGKPFGDFFLTYPVVFGVRRLGQEDQWCVTLGNHDEEQKILDCVS